MDGLCLIETTVTDKVVGGIGEILDELDNITSLIGTTCTTNFGTLFDGLCTINTNTETIITDGIGLGTSINSISTRIGTSCSSDFSSVFEGLCVINAGISNMSSETASAAALVGACTDQACGSSACPTMFGLLNLLAGALIQGTFETIDIAGASVTVGATIGGLFEVSFAGFVTGMLNVILSFYTGPSVSGTPVAIATGTLPAYSMYIENTTTIIATISSGTLIPNTYIVVTQFTCPSGLVVGTVVNPNTAVINTAS
jgi:hypothetical protein